MTFFRALLLSLSILVLAAYPLQFSWVYKPWPDLPGTHFFSALSVALIFVALGPPIGGTENPRRAFWQFNAPLLIVGLIVVWRLIEILTGLAVLDQIQALLIGVDPNAPSMGLLTDLALLSLTVALLLARLGSGVAAQMSFAAGICLTVVSLTGHVVGAHDYYGEMALFTTAFLGMVCVAALPEFRAFPPTSFFFQGKAFSRNMGLRALIYNANILLMAFLFTRLDPSFDGVLPLMVVAILVFQFGVFLQGTFTYVRTVHREQRQTDELKQLTEEANAANIAKSDFLAVISHELRTPLTGIMGLADLLRLSNLDEEQTRRLDELSGSAETLMILLNEVLDFSKIESGHLDLEKLPFSLKDTMNSVHGLFASSASTKGFLLDLDVSGITHEAVVGDQTRIRQIVSNIVNNAIKFTHKGSVNITVTQGETEDGSVLTSIEVKDTGVGIAAERLDTIFKPFSQADGTITRKFGGTGLGLSIAKSLVDFMGGAIRVESMVGLGSKFTIEVPLQVASAAQVTEIEKTRLGQEARQTLIAKRIKPVSDEAASLKGLITDDNATIRKLVEAMLVKAGHQVDLAVDGQEAVEKCRAAGFGYDFILMDMHMPVMNGIEASAMIREEEKALNPSRHMPIIAITADVLAENKQRCLDAGIDSVVGKPIDWLKLFAEIDLLTGQATSTEAATEASESDARAVSQPVHDDSLHAAGAASEKLKSMEDLPVMNMQVVDDLESALGKEVVDPMLTGFAESLAGHVDTFETAIETDDLAMLKKKAHAVKGLCKQFGAVRLGEVGAYMEYESESVDDIKACLPLLRTDSAEITEAVRAHVEGAA